LDISWSDREAPEPVAAPGPEPLGDVAAHGGDISISPVSALTGGLAEALGARTQTTPAGARRTVVIRGQGARGYVPARGGYETRLRPHERSGFKPDRVALWAVLLGLALLLGAVTSSHAAVLSHRSALQRPAALHQTAGSHPAAAHLLLHRALTHPAP
jgi:hypothetical protein